MAKTLRDWRLSKGWTLEQMAHKAGVGNSIISRAEYGCGNRRIHIDTAQKIVDALELSSVDDVIWPNGISYLKRDQGCPGPRGPMHTLDDAELHTLRWWRIKRGLTQQQLCQRADVSLNVITKIETNKAEFAVNAVVAQQLADTLGLRNIHEIKWPNGVSNLGRGSGKRGSPLLNKSTRTRDAVIATEVCQSCFMQKSHTGQCGCDW